MLATSVILTGNTLSVHAETKQENLPDSEVVEEFNVFNTDVVVKEVFFYTLKYLKV